MHEYPITEQIVKIAGKHCAEAGAGRVTKIILVCGEHSGISPESIDMYFNMIAEGTLCQGAGIEVELIKPKLKCPVCGGLFTRKPMSFACPDCGADGAPTEIGKEFYVKEIEVE